jgi:hypothetical protein
MKDLKWSSHEEGANTADYRVGDTVEVKIDSLNWATGIIRVVKGKGCITVHTR